MKKPPTPPISDERVESMTKTQESIREEYHSFTYWYFDKGYFTVNGEFPFKLLEDRICGQTERSLKAYFLKAIYEFFVKMGLVEVNETMNLLFTQQLPYIAEKMMSIQYYDNQILDRKGGVTDHDSIVHNLKLSALLKSVMYDYINDEEVFEKNTSITINKWVRKILNQVDAGQLLEKNNNLYANFINNTSNILYDHQNDQLLTRCIAVAKENILATAPELLNCEQFLEEYLKRVYLAGASMYPSMVLMALEILNLEKNDAIDTLLFFSGMSGITLQLVNDTIDNVQSCAAQKTVAKHSGNAFSDIKNGNITLPIMLHLLNSNTRLVENLITDQVFEISKGFEKAIFRELCDSNSLITAKSITRKLANYTMSILDDVPEFAKDTIVNYTDNYIKDINRITNYNKGYGFIETTIKARKRRIKKIRQSVKKLQSRKISKLKKYQTSCNEVPNASSETYQQFSENIEHYPVKQLLKEKAKRA